MSISSSVFSAGQKQLVCLARVILRKSRVVILDEATANVDMSTDSIIQDRIIEIFQDCVVITIAHRLSTIAHYDKVMVLDKGMVVEYDHPYKLLVRKVGDSKITNEKGMFASMVLRCGERVANEVFQKAYSTFYKK
jgi:ATP-binding cassette subfamily C (CFTR/MRP) protein 4